MPFSGLMIKVIELFCNTVSVFTAGYPGAFIRTNPVPARADGTNVRAVTFNLKCSGIGKTSVGFRERLLIAQLKEYDADSIGFQEATPEWLCFLKKGLTDYAYVGRTRDDGEAIGEANPVFYKKDKFNLIDYDTFWLSKTPDRVGSSDWNSSCNRICTWALLENRETKERYVHFNTHLDHKSPLARDEQINVVFSRLNKYIKDYPVVLTGDFNAFEDSSVYSRITSVLGDARYLAPVTTDMFTFHDYGERAERIDFVFVNSAFEPLVFHVIDDKILDFYLSDHFGIFVDLKLGTN